MFDCGVNDFNIKSYIEKINQDETKLVLGIIMIIELVIIICLMICRIREKRNDEHPLSNGIRPNMQRPAESDEAALALKENIRK